MFNVFPKIKQMVELLKSIRLRVKYMTQLQKDAELTRLLFLEEALRIPGVGKKGAKGWFEGATGYETVEEPILSRLEGRISVRLLATLTNAGLDTFEKIMGIKTYRDAQRYRNFGKKSFLELKELQKELAAAENK